MSGFQRLGDRVPISLTPGGAFQFGGAVHGSALLISPNGIFAWKPACNAAGEPDVLRFLDEIGNIRGDFVLLGTGPALVFPSPAFRADIERRGLGLEVMDTSAACRTYNVLVAEGRLFTAALLPFAQ